MASKTELEYRSRVASNLSLEDKLKIELMIEHHSRKEIAKELNISVSKLKRLASVFGWSFNYAKKLPYKKYTKDLVEEVIYFYEKNGFKKTQDSFSGVKVRSIVERYKRNKKLRSMWSDSEIIQAIKFGPFVSNKDQYKYFNRPNAFEGSIKSLWSKRIKSTKIKLHGLPKYKAIYFINDNAMAFKTKLKSIPEIYTWQTLKENLKNDCPLFLKEAIEVGYNFHVWLYGENPNKKIENIISHYSLE